MSNLVKEKIDSDNKGYSEAVLEFCRALVLSRTFENYNMKNWSTEKSKKELDYDGSLYSDYRAIQRIINKDRIYVEEKHSKFDKLSKKDLQLISRTIEKYSRLNYEKVLSGIAFNLQDFLEATKLRMQSGKPIAYFMLENSGELGYFRSYYSDFLIIRDIIKGVNSNRVKNSKSIREALTPDIIAQLKTLYEQGFFSTYHIKRSFSGERIVKDKNPLNIAEFVRAYKMYSELTPQQKGMLISFSFSKSKEILGYNRVFYRDCVIISNYVKGRDLEVNDLQLSKEDMAMLKNCGFIDNLIYEFDMLEFLRVLGAIELKYGKQVLFGKGEAALPDKAKTNELGKEFGYNRSFYGDFSKILSAMRAAFDIKNLAGEDICSSIDGSVEENMLPYLTMVEPEITRTFDVDKFIERFEREAEIRAACYKKAKAMKDEYGRDFKIDCILIQRAIINDIAPAYIKEQLTEEKINKIKDLFGLNKKQSKKETVLDRLDTFFKAWHNFLEIPKLERNYLDFAISYSLDILEYPYSFKKDYEEVARVYYNLYNNNVLEEEQTLSEHGIETNQFIVWCKENNFSLEGKFLAKMQKEKDKQGNGSNLEQ